MNGYSSKYMMLKTNLEKKITENNIKKIKTIKIIFKSKKNQNYNINRQISTNRCRKKKTSKPNPNPSLQSKSKHYPNTVIRNPANPTLQSKHRNQKPMYSNSRQQNPS